MSVIGKVTLDKNTEVQARINPGVCFCANNLKNDEAVRGKYQSRK